MSTEAEIKSASRRCTELLNRIIISEAIVGSVLEVPKVSETLKKTVLEEHLSRRSGVADAFSHYKVIEGYDASKHFPFLAQSMADLAVVNVEKVIAAAAVILSHSTADDAFTEACRVAIDLEPSKWITELNLDKKVSLRDLNDKGPQQIFEEELEPFKISLAGKSLPNRAAMLFKHIRIDTNSGMPLSRRFTMSELKKADELRVDLVHKNGLPGIDPASGERFMGFLHEAAHTAIRSVANAYNIPLDRDYLQSLMTPKKDQLG